MSRSFLLLQGTASLFFSRLTRALMAGGHNVLRVNFCGGDWAYARGGRKLSYCGELTDLAKWYSELVRRESISDIVMFGDCREVHLAIHGVAQTNGLRVHVFEEGYVRPNWITLERHGVNGRSRLPKDARWYRAHRHAIPPAQEGQPTGYNLHERVFHDIAYRAANALLKPIFRSYRSHRPRNGLLEYAGLASRAFRQKIYTREAEAVTRELLEGEVPWYLFPLQLNSDAQIIVHSRFDGIRNAIREVICSFACSAPDNALLVIKNHPLDTGLIEYRQYAQRLAEALNIGRRIRFIDAGHLPTLLDRARGVVVVNSTVGLSAIHHKRPLIALGDAIYKMEGLTWCGSLDDFWLNATAPDMELYNAFLSYVTQETQINGDFYTRSGIAMAVRGAVARLTRDAADSNSGLDG